MMAVTVQLTLDSSNPCLHFSFQTLNPKWNEEFFFRVSFNYVRFLYSHYNAMLVTF